MRNLKQLGEGTVFRYGDKKYKKKGRRVVRLGWFGRETTEFFDIEEIFMTWLYLDILTEGDYSTNAFQDELTQEAMDNAIPLSAEVETNVSASPVPEAEASTPAYTPEAVDHTTSYDDSARSSWGGCDSYDSGSSYDSGGSFDCGGCD